jgi:hypothetical protein
MRNAMQLMVDELDQMIEGCGVAPLPAAQQPCHVGCIGFSHYNAQQNLAPTPG